LEAIEQDDSIVMVYGRIQCVDERGKALFHISPGTLASLWMRIGHDFVPQPGSLFRSDAVARVGGVDNQLRYAMDLDLFLRLRQIGRLKYIPIEVATFRRHVGSLTVSNPNPGLEARKVRRHYLTPNAQRLESALFPIIDLVGRAWAKGFVRDPRWSRG
jgi:hypothetical protein